MTDRMEREKIMKNIERFKRNERWRVEKKEYCVGRTKKISNGIQLR